MFNWEAFHFLRPEWLLLLIPFSWIVYVLASKQQVKQEWQQIIAPHILKHLSVGRSEYRSINPTSVSAVAIVIMIIILAGPSWSRQVTPLSQDQSALVIMLDVSESMNQSDMQPSRLERSKQKIEDLLALRKGSKSALVVFAGSAHTVLPLSNDADILVNYLQAIKSGIVPVSGKFPEKALATISEFEIAPDIPLTMLWIGDGFGSQSRQAFSHYFSDHGQQLIIWGAGKTRKQLSEEQQQTISPLEAESLQLIASDNAGNYIPMTIDSVDVEKINRLVDRQFVDVNDKFAPWQDQGYYLVFVLLPIFLLWFRRGWTLHWGFVLAIGLFSATPNPAHAGDNAVLDFWFTADQQGHWHYYRGNYRIAAERFQDPLWKGIAYYQAEEFKLAADYFSRVDSEEGLFDYASALAQGQHYLKAMAVYDRLLAINPEYPSAKANRRIIRELVDQINRMSESQVQEGGDSSKELGENDPQRAEGAEYQSMEKQEVKQLSADDIQQDQKLQDMWMRAVQPDPSNFLAAKFSMQSEMAEPQNKEGAEQ